MMLLWDPQTQSVELVQSPSATHPKKCLWVNELLGLHLTLGLTLPPLRNKPQNLIDFVAVQTQFYSFV